MRFSIRFGLALALLSGCGSSGVELTANASADLTATTGFVPSTPGGRLIGIDVTLVNDAGQDLPLTTSNFRIDPTTGVSVLASDFTEQLPGACITASGAVLPDGNSASCLVAFEVPAGFNPSTLTYSHEDVSDSDDVPPLGVIDRDAGPGMDAGPGTPTDAGRLDAGDPPPPTDQMDLLFMVDNSNSMTEEQSNLAAELPRLIRILSTGDADQDGDFFGDMEVNDRDFPPIVSLNVGVITSDMGTGGFTIPTCANSQFGDDGILRTQGAPVPGCAPTYPSFLNFLNGGGGGIGDFAADVACVAVAGTGGCGFEQPLEAVLKALSPTSAQPGVASFYDPPRFFQNSEGNGDVENDGFLREDSVLGIFVLTDEEDCSAADPELFNPTSATYTSDLNLRCFTYADAALHPASRYVNGITQLRSFTQRIAYILVAGVPVDLVPTAGQPIDWDRLVSDDPALRDDRLEERIDPVQPNRLVPSCNEPGTGLAFPPIRMLRVARELEANGANVGISSICSSNLSPAVDTLIEATGLAVRR